MSVVYVISPLITHTTSKIHTMPGHRAATDRCRYNFKWTRTVQDAILTVLLDTWIGGSLEDGKPGEVGRLLTLEEVGDIFKGTVTFSMGRAVELTAIHSASKSQRP